MTSLTKLVFEPSKEQQEFIAKLFQEDREYWQNWFNKNQIEEIENWIFFFIPVLNEKINELGIQTNSVTKVAGIYKKSIYRNQLIINELKKLNALLISNKITPIFLCEFSLYFQNITSARYFKSIDMLLPTEAEQFIIESGWIKLSNTTFRTAQDFKIEIKWQNSINKRLIKESIGHKLSSFNLISLEALVVILCSYCNYTNPNLSISWVYDLIKTIKMNQSLDWQRIFNLAKDLNLSTHLHHSLKQIEKILPGSIPSKDKMPTQFSFKELYYFNRPALLSLIYKVKYLFSKNP